MKVVVFVNGTRFVLMQGGIDITNHIYTDARGRDNPLDTSSLRLTGEFRRDPGFPPHVSGDVAYCPYCGVRLAVALAAHTCGVADID